MATSAPVKLAKWDKLKSPLVLLLIAALLAAGVSWIAYYYLQQREAAMKEEISAKGKAHTRPRVNVAVPISDVPVGTVLNDTNFVSRPVEEDLVYPDTVLASDFSSMEGLKLARPILRGRPLRLSDLVAPEVSDVAAILPAGQRAMTIEIDNLNSIAHTLRPNHRIDLFLLTKGARHDGGANEGDASLEQATLFMQDMIVLATGTEFRDVAGAEAGAATKMARPGEVPGKEKEFDTVTLLVTPKEAARLMVGQKMGSYRVVLRGTRDRAPVALATLRGADMLPATSRPALNAGIEFIVGGAGNKLLGQLPVARLQDGLPNLLAARPPPQDPSPADPGRTNVTISVPTTRANSPVAAFSKGQ